MASFINPTSIPSITALRQELDYGDPNLSRCQAFYDSVRVFRKTFVTSQGLEGSSFHDWRSREHQTALGEMVRSYLDLHGNGRLFWPDDNSQGRANKLRYSTDSARIKKIMRQLFWRLNIQQYRNVKYKKNKDLLGKIEELNRIGLGRDIGKDADVVGDTSASRDDAETPGTARSSTFPSITDPSFGVNTSVVDPDLHEAPSSPSKEREISEDPYRVPDSPDVRIPSPLRQPISADLPTGLGNHGGQVAPYANMEPSAKRKRRDDGTSTRPMSSKRAGKQPAEVWTSRVSPRKRKLRHVPGSATAEQLSAAFQSLERTPSSEVVEIPVPAPSSMVTSEGLSTCTLGATYPLRATVEDVADEDESVNAFIGKAILDLGTEIRPHSTEQTHGTTHVGPSARATLAEAAHEPSVMVKPATRQSSPIPLISSPAPAEGREVVSEMSTETKVAPQAPPTGQARVDFLYRVVCHHPQRQSFSWKPEGGLRKKTLAKLEEELSMHSMHSMHSELEWSQFKYLHFRLVAPNTRAEQLVCRGREEQFDALKRHLGGFIRDCIADMPCDKTVFVEIEIELLLDVNSVRKSTDREVMDVDW